MNFIIVGEVFSECSLQMSVCMCTVSNAFVMSMAVAIVRRGGTFVLKPCAMVWFITCRAVVVECFCLKPC